MIGRENRDNGGSGHPTGSAARGLVGQGVAAVAGELWRRVEALPRPGVLPATHVVRRVGRRQHWNSANRGRGEREGEREGERRETRAEEGEREIAEREKQAGEGPVCHQILTAAAAHPAGGRRSVHALSRSATGSMRRQGYPPAETHTEPSMILTDVNLGAIGFSGHSRHCRL